MILISDDKEAFNASVPFPIQQPPFPRNEAAKPVMPSTSFMRSPSLVKELLQLYTA